MNHRTILVACSLLTTAGASSTAFAESGGERGATAEAAPLLEGDGDSISGQLDTQEGGHVQFHAEVIGEHAVAVQLQTPTLAATFTPDFDTGRLTIQANAAELHAEDWRAIVEALDGARASAGEGLNPMAGLYLIRTLGMLAESTPGTVWESRTVALPTLHPDDPSFFGSGGSGPAVAAAGRTLETLSRGDGAASLLFADPSVGLMARPPGSGDEGPSPGAGTGSSSSSWKGPKCGGEYFSDKANGKISCVEYGNYYCIEYDYYPGSIAAGQKTVRAVAPTIPPGRVWPRETAAKVDVYYGGKEAKGAYPCSGQCGPGCEPAPAWAGGGGGGWGVGCLIHDQCVYQATGGQQLDKLWEQPKNIMFSTDCGQEMMDAADDHYMPPDLCPGFKTVGGTGRWVRQPPPPIVRYRFKNTVSSKRTKSVGKVKKP